MVESVAVSISSGLLHVFGQGLLSLLMCWLMVAMEFAIVVSSSRLVVAEEGRLIKTSWYSAGVGFRWWVCDWHRCYGSLLVWWCGVGHEEGIGCCGIGF